MTRHCIRVLFLRDICARGVIHLAAAYRALALTATVAGRWEDAAGHWKNALFLATSDDSEYLQRLGALLVGYRSNFPGATWT